MAAFRVPWICCQFEYGIKKAGKTPFDFPLGRLSLHVKAKHRTSCKITSERNTRNPEQQDYVWFMNSRRHLRTFRTVREKRYPDIIPWKRPINQWSSHPSRSTNDVQMVRKRPTTVKTSCLRLVNTPSLSTAERTDFEADYTHLSLMHGRLVASSRGGGTNKTRISRDLS